MRPRAQQRETSPKLASYSRIGICKGMNGHMYFQGIHRDIRERAGLYRDP